MIRFVKCDALKQVEKKKITNAKFGGLKHNGKMAAFKGLAFVSDNFTSLVKTDIL